MATVSNNMASAVDRITTCPICFDYIDDPRTLACLHTFCLACLQAHCATHSQGDVARCPVCRAQFKIPPNGGVKQLTGSFVVRELLEVQAGSERRRTTVAASSTGVPCDVCVDYDEGEDGADCRRSAVVPEATMYCTNCGQKLCARCSRTHRKMPGGKHAMATLDDKASEQTARIQKGDVESCAVHVDSRLEMYCLDCQVNACPQCCSDEHATHDYRPIVLANRELRKSLRPAVEAVCNSRRAVINEQHKIKEMIKDFSREYESARKSVIDAEKEMTRKISDAVDLRLAELAEIKTTANETLEDTQKRLTESLSALTSFIGQWRESLDQVNPVDFPKKVRAMKVLAEDLLARDRINVDETRCRLPDMAAITPPPRLYILHYISAYFRPSGIINCTCNL